MSGELKEQVMDELQWLKRGDQSSADACKNIIALVQQHERRRIREKLLSDEAVSKAAKQLLWACDFDSTPEERDNESRSEAIDVITAALAAIGLTEEQETGHE